MPRTTCVSGKECAEVRERLAVVERGTIGHVLVVDDELDALSLMRSALEPLGRPILTASTLGAALQALDDAKIDAVVTDLELGDASGLDLCARVVERQPDLPVLVVTGHASLDVTVDAMRIGVFDFLTKPIQLDQLRHRVQLAVAHRELAGEVKRLRRSGHEPPPGDHPIIGESPPMIRLFGLLSRLADSDTSVLVTGESGVGKELVARALHTGGTDARRPFVAINCAAVPPTLIESELFGHVRGAFTDAKRDHDGLFSRADGGTLFLDEIAELPMPMQPKLLRALQERRVTPVGGSREIPFDVRVVSATNKDLEHAVAEGRFREDLYYRLDVVEIPVPPLRARGSDVLLLAQYFIARAARRMGRPVKGLSAEVAEKLLGYDWPGNVRELENAMEHGVALAEFEEIRVGDLPSTVRAHRPRAFVVSGADPQAVVPLAQVSERYVRHVLQAVDGNKARAARILGLGRRTLYRRLAREGADNPDAGDRVDPPVAVIHPGSAAR